MRRVSVLALSIWGLTALGCVAQADYDQVLAQNKSLEAEKVAYADRAQSAESQAEAMRRQILGKEQELSVQKSMSSSLQNQYDQMHQAFRSSQDILAGVDLNPQKPLVIRSVLPAELDRALKNFASSHAAIEYDSARGAVKWTSDLLFASGSDVVREDAASTLRSFAAIVNSPAARKFDVVVVGHTDTDPIRRSKAKHPTNWHLSAHRAIAVAGVLMAAQISPERVGIMGYSEFRPIDANDSDEGKAGNRRVEIFIVGGGAVGSQNTEQASAAQSAPGQASGPQK